MSVFLWGIIMKVAIIKDDQLHYCVETPYHPPERYPEYPYTEISRENTCYPAVRDILHKLGMDSEHFGKSSWNPLGEVVKPGDNVFIKPNFVSHKNSGGSTDSIITHGSVIRAVTDYVLIALKGKGSIIIGDAPYIDTDYDKILKISGISKVAAFYGRQGGVKVQVVDLRKEVGKLRLGRIEKSQTEGDTLGYSVIDLKSDSEHSEIAKDAQKFRAVYYDRHEMQKHHTVDKNEYMISNTVLNADVVINVPKLKTHAKTGISCALKSMVGINGIKDWLPHHRAGAYESGGDEYFHKDLRKDLYAKLKDEAPTRKNALAVLPIRAVTTAIYATKYIFPFNDDITGGSWYGNDTLPRSICDLNKILLYADKHGVMRHVPQRKTFILVDGIVAGEGEGPMANSDKKCGVLIAGYNPVEVDIVSTIIMGFDPRKISTIKYALETKKYSLYKGDLAEIKIVSDRCSALDEVYNTFNCSFTPPKTWAGHIEYERSPPIGSSGNAPAATPQLRH